MGKKVFEILKLFCNISPMRNVSLAIPRFACFSCNNHEFNIERNTSPDYFVSGKNGRGKKTPKK